MAVNVSSHSGTATDYKDLLDDLVSFVTNDQINTVAVNAGGTGYAVDDIVTLSGGTSLVAATFRVTAVSSGVVTGLSVFNGGSYSVNTGATAVATTGGTGTGLTVDVTYQTPWSANQNFSNQGAVLAVVVAGGSGYSVNDTLTVSGGTFTTAATFNVDAVSSGAVTAVSLVTNGDYTALPTNPVATTVSPSGGTGCTLTVTFDGQNSEQQVQLQGIGSGSDQIYVGVRTFQDSGESSHAWELAGFTGFAAGTWTQQPGISPGRFDGTDGGAYMILANASTNYWFTMTGRWIAVVAKIGGRDFSMFLGFGDPFGTASELPYPLVIAACCGQPDTANNSSRQSLSSVVWPVGKANTSSVTSDANVDNGPVMLRDGNGSWVSLMVQYETNTSESVVGTYRLRYPQPPGRGQNVSGLPTENNNWIRSTSGQGDWDDIAPVGIAADPATEMRPTPDGGSGQPSLWPITYISNHDVNDLQIYLQLPAFKWCSTAGTSLVSEDTVTVDLVKHRIFNSAAKAEHYHRYVLEERS